MALMDFVEKPWYKKFMTYLYGWGASVVIIGALFKIMHYPGAALMLILGMGTEAIIFFFSVFDKPHPDPAWERVYPALKNNPDGSPFYAEGTAPLPAFAGAGGGISSSPEQNLLSEKLDEMLKKANVSPEVFERLSSGIEKLTETTKHIGNLPNMAAVNNDYAEQMMKMSQQMQALNQFYATQMQASQERAEAEAQLHRQQLEANAKMQQMQAETTAKMQQELKQMMENVSSSLESSVKYRQEIDDLSNKVATLNKVYGQMLSAMGSGAKN